MNSLKNDFSIGVVVGMGLVVVLLLVMGVFKSETVVTTVIEDKKAYSMVEMPPVVHVIDCEYQDGDVPVCEVVIADGWDF